MDDSILDYVVKLVCIRITWEFEKIDAQISSQIFGSELLGDGAPLPAFLLYYQENSCAQQSIGTSR